MKENEEKLLTFITKNISLETIGDISIALGIVKIVFQQLFSGVILVVIGICFKLIKYAIRKSK